MMLETHDMEEWTLRRKTTTMVIVMAIEKRGRKGKKEDGGMKLEKIVEGRGSGRGGWKPVMPTGISAPN